MDAATVPSFWVALMPDPSWLGGAIPCMAQVLSTQGVRAALRDACVSGEYPQDVIDRLHAAGLGRVLIDRSPSQSENTSWHLGALAELLGRTDGSLAISVCVTGLALLPLYLAGTDDQLESTEKLVHTGGSAALLLTELGRGSDLLANDTVATRATSTADGSIVSATADDFTHWQIFGAKQLINGGMHHDLLVVLARTGAGGRRKAAAVQKGFSLLLVAPDTPGCAPLPRRRTLSVRSADISGVAFNGAPVPRDAVVGREGRGIELTLGSLGLARAGVSAIAAGAAMGAFDVAATYVAGREIYGGPLAALDPIVDHLMQAGALSLVAAAASLKATALVNTWGRGAWFYAGTAKVVAATLAEEAVTEARRILGAQALLEDGPGLDGFIRDVLLYGVFDGTTDVVLHHLAPQAARMVSGQAPSGSLAALRSAYGVEPKPILQQVRQRATVTTFGLADHARELAGVTDLDATPLVDAVLRLASAVGAAVRSDRWTDGGVRGASAWAVALAEALCALLELGDPGARRALDMRPLQDGGALAPWVEYSLATVGARLAARHRCAR